MYRERTSAGTQRHNQRTKVLPGRSRIIRKALTMVPERVVRQITGVGKTDIGLHKHRIRRMSCQYEKSVIPWPFADNILRGAAVWRNCGPSEDMENFLSI